MTRYIAVYGTLKKGFHNHRLLKEARFVGKGKTKGKYLLTTIAGNLIEPDKKGVEPFQKFEKKDLEETPFPYVFENREQYPIEVELYEVTEKQLKACDRLESVPYFYYRKTVEILLADEIVRAEMYFITVR
ncbi:MAG TPA: gamma-glutamylcyclotransferase [Thermotogota bacterium]|nr:gamma-glutamylcyclotransferase [Thermotogota bacterium]HPR96218.1 gamma-glutamylcyclotransferase [Thermotogota bacterium]